jgi:hypothetical protein
MTRLTPEIRRFVTHQRLAHVATVSREGLPHVSPKGSLRVFGDDELVWADIQSTVTVQNIRANPRTEIEVVDVYVRKGYRFKGTSRVLESGDVHNKVVGLYHSEGADVSRINAIVLMRVESVSTLISPVYAKGFDEREVGRLWEEYYSRSFLKSVLDLVPPQEF